MSGQDWVDLGCPCGCRIGLLILVDARRCAGYEGDCLPAQDIARALLREWHREAVPNDRPA